MFSFKAFFGGVAFLMLLWLGFIALSAVMQPNISILLLMALAALAVIYFA